MENYSQNQGLKSREVALEVFSEVTNGTTTFDEAIALNLTFSKLDVKDRAFVHLLVNVTLRHHGQLDIFVNSYLKHALPKRAKLIKNILQLGAAQLLFLESPPHAVVNTAVLMCRRFPGQKGLVNAILRKISLSSLARFNEIDIRFNTPRWLWENWLKHYGEKNAREIAVAHTIEPPLDITVIDQPHFWAEKLRGNVQSGNTVRLKSRGDITRLPGFKEGKWWVQDYAASLPANILLSMLPQNGRNLKILDLCAAPGGKTAQLATSGASVTAVDKSSKRMEILKINMKRLKLSVDTIIADARVWKPKEPQDGILLDLPCSATGVIRRHPDLPLKKSFNEIQRLAKMQVEITTNALQMLKVKGVLVYSVCSLQKEEAEDVVNTVVSKCKGISPAQFEVSVPGEPVTINKIKAGFRTKPSDNKKQGGMDGFFIFAFRRKF